MPWNVPNEMTERVGGCSSFKICHFEVLFEFNRHRDMRKQNKEENKKDLTTERMRNAGDMSLGHSEIES